MAADAPPPTPRTEMTPAGFEAFVEQFRRGNPAPSIAPARHRVIPPAGKSEGEGAIHGILTAMGFRHGYEYFSEHTFAELGPLRFDFFIPSHRALIEFDGEQHYTGSRFHRTRADWLKAVERDESKNRFCGQRGYSLIRIPPVYLRRRRLLTQLVEDFVRRAGEANTPIVEVDLYFQWKAGLLRL